eukprot:TRINITY_DN18517_c0_g1_i1.p1 TRINITY_DN18517_c0_g1~~TRINITY_DN18517_c0_g1_i1.p1  ORF type:complete len:336 (-),score=79.48 TRINITY_DN18517_c0_g1_i1:186-1193(-)
MNCPVETVFQTLEPGDLGFEKGLPLGGLLRGSAVVPQSRSVWSVVLALAEATAAAPAAVPARSEAACRPPGEHLVTAGKPHAAGAALQGHGIASGYGMQSAAKVAIASVAAAAVAAGGFHHPRPVVGSDELAQPPGAPAGQRAVVAAGLVVPGERTYPRGLQPPSLAPLPAVQPPPECGVGGPLHFQSAQAHLHRPMGAAEPPPRAMPSAAVGAAGELPLFGAQARAGFKAPRRSSAAASLASSSAAAAAAQPFASAAAAEAQGESMLGPNARRQFKKPRTALPTPSRAGADLGAAGREPALGDDGGLAGGGPLFTSAAAMWKQQQLQGARPHAA